MSNRPPKVVQGKGLLLRLCTWEVQWWNCFRLVYFSSLGCLVLWVAGPYFLLSVVFISILAPLSAKFMLLHQLRSRKHWWSSAGRNTSHGSESLSPKDTEVLPLELPGSLSSRLGQHRGTCLCQFLGLNQWPQLILGLELCQSYGFSSSHVWMWELDHREGWALNNWCFQIVVLEKTFESPLDNKEFKPVHPKVNQPWILIVRANAEAEAPILWPVNGQS